MRGAAKLRANAIAEKKNRRMEVGPYATFYFENYQSMWLQVQEMLRIEKGGAEQVAGELEAYNPLIPQGSELIATVMIEIEDADRRDRELRRLGHIEDSALPRDRQGPHQGHADGLRGPHHAGRQDLVGALAALRLHAGADRGVPRGARSRWCWASSIPITATWR
ncbi:MAG: DUF3501 family protein [Rhizomicrobium sp.]